MLFAGEVISTKREELDNIIATMNIQIDNPICVLNQDVSRTFLITSKPHEKYHLFMKATLLDTIENNYKEALEMCEEEYEKLSQYSEVYIYIFDIKNFIFLCKRIMSLLHSFFQTLTQVKKDIQKLKTNVQTVEKLDKTRDELNNLEMELYWATVNFYQFIYCVLYILHVRSDI